MTTEELIARLEAATGPSRKLDVALFAFVGLSDLQERHCAQWVTNNKDHGITRDHYLFAWAPSYTASIDAALQLVPDNYDCLVCCVNGKWQATCGPENSFQDVGDQKGATPAIALCLAALKAGEKA